MQRLFAASFAALLATLSFGAAAQLTDKKALTLEAAKKIAAAAEAEALKNKWNVVIAVVDDGGHLIYLQRMDTTQTGSIDVAVPVDSGEKAVSGFSSPAAPPMPSALRNHCFSCVRPAFHTSSPIHRPGQ